MARQGSRGLGGDGTMSTAQSMVADNLPEPYQPPASNATSEDVHVGLGACSPYFPFPVFRLWECIGHKRLGLVVM